jgi:outer membrane lipoprotein-sorting protein
VPQLGERKNTMMQCWFLAAFLFLFCTVDLEQVNAAGDMPAKQVVAISEKILHVFEKLEDFRCDVEAQYYRRGKEHQLYRFTFWGERAGTTRIKFSRPYPGLTTIYKKGEHTVTVQPFSLLPFIKLTFSLYHSLVRSPSGQRMDQTGIEYLSRFFYNNVKCIQQHESSFSDAKQSVSFAFWAEDYTGGKELNRYFVTVSKDNWLPLRIERYNNDNVPIEMILFKNFMVHDP